MAEAITIQYSPPHIFVHCWYVVTLSALTPCPEPHAESKCPYDHFVFSRSLRETCFYAPRHRGLTDADTTPPARALWTSRKWSTESPSYNSTHLMFDDNSYSPFFDTRDGPVLLPLYCYRLNGLMTALSLEDNVLDVVDVFNSRRVLPGFEYADACRNLPAVARMPLPETIEISALEHGPVSQVYIHDCALKVHVCFAIATQRFHTCTLDCHVQSIPAYHEDFAPLAFFSAWLHLGERTFARVLEPVVRGLLSVFYLVAGEIFEMAWQVLRPLITDVLLLLLRVHVVMYLEAVLLFATAGYPLTAALYNAAWFWIPVTCYKVNL